MKLYVSFRAHVLALLLGAVTPAAGQSVRITEQPDSVFRLFGTYITAGGSVVSNRTILWAVVGPCTVTAVPGTSYGRHVYVRGTDEGDCRITGSTTVSGRTYRETLNVVSRQQMRFVVSRAPVAPPPPPLPPPPPPPPPPPSPAPLKAIIVKPVVCVGLECVLDGRGSTGAIAKYEWWSLCLLCGTGINFTGPVWNYTAPAATTRTRVLRVTGTSGAISEDTVTFTPGTTPAPDTTITALDVKPDVVTLQPGQALQFCAFIRFANGATAVRSQDRPACDSQYAALLPKAPSSAQQAKADAFCVTWRATGGTITASGCDTATSGVVGFVRIRAT